MFGFGLRSSRESREEREKRRTSQRHRLRQTIVAIHDRVSRICDVLGAVQDAREFLDALQEPVNEIRDLLDTSDAREFMPYRGRKGLQNVIKWFEKQGGTIERAAKGCDRMDTALDFAESVLDPSSLMDKVWDRVLDRVLESADAYIPGGAIVGAGASAVAVTGITTAVVLALGDGPVEPVREPAVVPLVIQGSRENDGATANLGRITLQDIPRPLPASVNLRPTVGPAEEGYAVDYAPAEGYAFERWEVSGGLSVRCADCQSTTVSITDGGALTAIYAEEIPPELTLESVAEDDASRNLGRIVLNNVVHALPGEEDAPAQGLSVSFTPAEGYDFVGWETSGGVSVDCSGCQTTTVTLGDTGGLVAVYQQSIAMVSLSSHEGNFDSENLGEILLDGVSFDLPTEIDTPVGRHRVRFTVPAGRDFVGWETSGGISVDCSGCQTTTVTVGDTGGLVAVYQQSIAEVSLSSHEGNFDSENLGEIDFGGVSFDLPAEIDTPVGRHRVRFAAPEGHDFVGWETSGGVSVDCSACQTTTVTVGDTGGLVAVYQQSIAMQSIAMVSLSSHEGNFDSENLGEILLDGVSFDLPTEIDTPVGRHRVRFTVPAGRDFVGWETSGGISVDCSGCQTTTVTVGDTGGLVAVYQQSIAEVSLSSHEVGFVSENRGEIDFDSVSFGLPTEIDTHIGRHRVGFTVPAGNDFVGWEARGGVSVVCGGCPITTMTASGDGTLTAIYGRALLVVTLESREDNFDSENLGEIVFDGVSLDLSADVDTAVATHPVRFEVPEGHNFVGWETSGGVSVDCSACQTTTVTVGDTGGLVAVYQARVTRVEVDTRSVSIREGQSTQLSATATDELFNVLAGRPISWSTDAPQVATVGQDGLVAGRAVGCARVTATSEGVADDTWVTVLPGVTGAFRQTRVSFEQALDPASVEDTDFVVAGGTVLAARWFSSEPDAVTLMMADYASYPPRPDVTVLGFQLRYLDGERPVVACVEPILEEPVTAPAFSFGNGFLSIAFDQTVELLALELDGVDRLSEAATADSRRWIVSLSDLQVGLHTVTVTAAFEGGAPSSFSWQFSVSAQELKLLSGWNLVGPPRAPLDPDINSVFDGYESVTQIITYDPRIPGGFLVALRDRTGEPWSGTLKEFAPPRGYWVFSTKAVTVEIPLSSSPVGRYALAPGWNLVAYYSAMTDPIMPVGDYLAGTADAWIRLLAFDTEAAQWSEAVNPQKEISKAAAVAPEAPGQLEPADPVGRLKLVRAWQAYWLYVDDSAVLAPAR